MSAKTRIGAIAHHYQLQVGDLIEFLADDGRIKTGRVVLPYGRREIVHGPQGHAIARGGYGIDIDGVDRGVLGLPFHVDVEKVWLRPDIAASREDNAFQMLLSGVLTAPRRGRPPKSPYPAAPSTAKRAARKAGGAT